MVNTRRGRAAAAASPAPAGAAIDTSRAIPADILNARGYDAMAGLNRAEGSCPPCLPPGAPSFKPCWRVDTYGPTKDTATLTADDIAKLRNINCSMPSQATSAGPEPSAVGQAHLPTGAPSSSGLKGRGSMTSVCANNATSAPSSSFATDVEPSASLAAVSEDLSASALGLQGGVKRTFQAVTEVPLVMGCVPPRPLKQHKATQDPAGCGSQGPVSAFQTAASSSSPFDLPQEACKAVDMVRKTSSPLIYAASGSAPAMVQFTIFSSSGALSGAGSCSAFVLDAPSLPAATSSKQTMEGASCTMHRATSGHLPAIAVGGRACSLELNLLELTHCVMPQSNSLDDLLAGKEPTIASMDSHAPSTPGLRSFAADSASGFSFGNVAADRDAAACIESLACS